MIMELIVDGKSICIIMIIIISKLLTRALSWPSSQSYKCANVVQIRELCRFLRPMLSRSYNSVHRIRVWGFKLYQITDGLCSRAGANPGAKIEKCSKNNKADDSSAGFRVGPARDGHTSWSLSPA